MKRSPIRKKSKQPVSKLKKECMALVKQMVSIRDKDICQRCDKECFGSDRHRSHVVPVSAGNKLAFDPMNMKVLCYNCHMHFWHKNPRAAADWFRKKFPERDAYLAANEGILQMKYFDWVELKEKLIAELEILK